MAELDLRENISNIYSDVEEDSALPLLIRYRNEDVNYQNKETNCPFDDIVSKISGIHECYFIHRHQYAHNKKIYEELAIKVDDLPYSITVQLSRDKFSLWVPHFNFKNLY